VTCNGEIIESIDHGEIGWYWRTIVGTILIREFWFE